MAMYPSRGPDEEDAGEAVRPKAFVVVANRTGEAGLCCENTEGRWLADGPLGELMSVS
jgi:hypothetical protein